MSQHDEDYEPERRTSTVSYQLSQKKLHRLLAGTRPDDFMRLIWALDASQDGRGDEARKVIGNLPLTAKSGDSNVSYAVGKWELETLVTEYLITEQERIKNNRVRWTDVSKFELSVQIVNALKSLEDKEASRYCNNENIFHEVARISHRQFHWQRGYLNKANFYRSSYIYGQGHCLEYFESHHQITPNDLSIIGFSFYASTAANWGVSGTWDLSLLGVTPEAFRAGIKLVSAPIDRLRELARATRVSSRPVAYQACPLRKFPMVEFSQGLVAPIRDLVLQRTTSGMYYDLVGAGGAVLSEIGARFESYAGNFLDGVFTDLKVRRETTYGTKARPYASPDLRITDGEICQVVVECKATKMTLSAQFSNLPTEEAGRGLGELSKGVFQIWRYCSHVRRGLLDDELADNSIGLLLTLDHWAMMSKDAYVEIIAGAERLASRDCQIKVEHRLPIVISAIDDVETAATQASDQGFLETLRRASNSEYAGWLLPQIQQRHGLVAERRKSHPFSDSLGELLPWWDRFGRMASSGSVV